MADSCATCFFYRDGACHHDAPYPGKFASVEPSDWCGEGADSTTQASFSTGVTGIPGKPVGGGFFTLDAAISTAISNSSIDATNRIVVTPTNAAAGALLAVHGYYIVVVDVAFTFWVADGAVAAGTETFSYVIL